ncbi:MAG: bacteriohopanetetrol glucosamine biosynthesis glycosyltransferase HpnI [Acidobacteria bacterium]|nr:bacteriohopanetetrol glucosamine biosynthesis glycosyltransferase HpnI [Acidobacteriota bacterium]
MAVFSWGLTALLIGMVVGATCYTLIALYAACKFQRTKPLGSVGFTPPVSLLKPLYGLDRKLERNLESFCTQTYPVYEILFSVRHESDPSVAVVRKLQQQFPSLPIRLLVTGPPRYLNAKVHGLEEMAKAARYDIFIISDSDVRVGPEYLKGVVAPFAGPSVGMTTCLSRGVPSNSVWSVMEALGMNTQFLPGVLSAWLLIGMEFALGPTMVIRKQQLEEIGGFRILRDYLADDFVLGETVAKAGYGVVLTHVIPDHLFGGHTMSESLAHRLRWERSSKCSRPAGYVGQVFTHSLPLALLAVALAPQARTYVLAMTALCIVARFALAWKVGWSLLRDSTLRKFWWLLPIEDLLSFGIWCWAFFGGEIVWRGTRLKVLRGGKMVATGNAMEEPAPAATR